MSNLVDAMKREAHATTTENGMKAYSTTESKMLDFFAIVGAMRERSEADIIEMFDKAFNEDSTHAIKCIFYARDIRGGLGERRTGRILLKHLAKTNPELLIKNFGCIAQYGRWDDFYEFVGTPVEKEMWLFLKEQLELDLANLNAYNNGDKEAGLKVSLLGKWIKTPDSKTGARKLGIQTALALGYSVYDFKRILRKLRKHLNVVECKMCAKEWEQINFSAVPSKAMMNYRDAFSKHTPELYAQFLEKVKMGEAKINSGALYPYDIVRAYGSNFSFTKPVDDTLEEQWKALPNYADSKDSILVMADVSGSMEGLPMDCSISLAIYFAQRNNGAFKNLFMTFESKPSFVSIEDCKNLHDAITVAARASWGGSTNFIKAMEAILDLCVKNNVPAEEVPKALVCISDMEFDCASYSWEARHNIAKNTNATLYEELSEKFDASGYTIPKIVFWNVNARNNTFHIEKSMPNTMCISGSSASSFKSVIDAIDMTPMEAMYNVLDDERYDSVITE